ncbi:16S rRNA (uracil(1498)-N(3))-methyltransferase [Gymnodinialimonas ceratoperidinii]|uniref:Ribosomal RNA small subunit methyltransferase E n=1 Tax=Gymnodinialimonas ceratoperidinii TaxID=2856823 RepID=A0A8F6TXM4_9RHOB|nr:16S rRNA (uracil(1498)-N(3))-methyltransferase [Gymnodinialimonas ceratoperidinii]QXT40333.1 16S rRNA (uracil(1498)-N(3))-methyltransferase [Gymnodinialimonas ceratoperidinii]
MKNRPKIRLYVDHPLGEAQSVPVSRDHANYLFNVMRLGVGAKVALFNGTDGEWRAEVAAKGKRGGVLLCTGQSAPQRMPPDLWLLFAPIKKARTDFIVEKAAELGAARILPVRTDYTNSDRIRQDKLQAHAMEAAEQCGGTYVPPVSEIRSLAEVLDGWDESRVLVFADETTAADAATSADAASDEPATSAPLSRAPAPAAILIGPEGGFSEAERARLRALPFVHVISLGPRILRADTAAVAALTLWQEHQGDWK